MAKNFRLYSPTRPQNRLKAAQLAEPRFQDRPPLNAESNTINKFEVDIFVT